MEESKKVIFSGVKPSGDLTLGNYLGAIKNWVKLQEEYECYFCVMDLHAITVKQEPKDLRRRTLEILAIYLASGIDPDKNTLFIQSHVPAHCEASWLLTCCTYMGELSRMTQYKDKSKNSGGSISAGLFNYPTLMAADILLYQSNLVPVGKDQFQHLEMARNIAERFNKTYSDTFALPEAYTAKAGAKIMDLQDPTKKMSKSEKNVNGYILIMDPPEVIRKKVNRAVTDSLGVVKYNDEQLGVKNLMTILMTINNVTIEEIENKYQGLGYSQFKKDVAEAIVSELEPIQVKTKEYIGNKAYLEGIYKKGSDKASYVSNKTLRKMQKKMGFIPR
ncbi:tryptophan--tRNA ligase [Clostridium psychrophilum]|uniref:tryptophan--tRNA ligase n=1 Tax=Clostridium psychrophilum TaxID=132926 RepID=UPI001C0CAF93|nr:tryptophan--tRNA ligase [Clostridium psychrophilum]MBU3179632.1 tryptophan--tRNA ligase [Clostridium psychrophilum]